MIPELHKILYGEVDHIPRAAGRRSSGIKEPDSKLTAGKLADRIKAYLSTEAAATAADIADAIDASAGKIRGALNKMAQSGLIDVIQVEGCVTEYALKRNP